ncbi:MULTISPECIES: RHS repeat-associated core domain-containing protein [Paenibacillus]|uniref:RHS repeat-associated core domain-containing protein n=1 Tax=Paenibacillus TaxID=44249 RepID=UPI0008FBB02A|nr:RHS repeat-associated core domain-containing protein [Paenibacillus polymyxa]
MTARLKKITSIIIITAFIFGWVGEVVPSTIFATEESSNPVASVTSEVYSAGSELDRPLPVKASVYDEVYGWQVRQGTFIELKGDEMPKTVIGSVYSTENYDSSVTDQVYGNTNEMQTNSVTNDVYWDDSKKTPPFILSLLSMKMAAVKPPVVSEQAPVYDKTKFNEAPYSVGNNGESISTLTGNLSLESTDMTLPGRNGLGFSLRRQYNTSDAQFYEMDVLDNSYDQSLYKYWVNYNAVKRLIIPQYEVKFTQKRWKQYDYGNDGSVDQETDYQYVNQTKGPYSNEATARNTAAELRTYQIPDDQKRVNDYRTQSRSSNFTGSIFYSKNGYSGTLYTSGSPYVISGSYSQGGSKTITDSCTNSIPGKYDSKGIWQSTGSGSSCPASKSYNSDGYTGTLNRSGVTDTVKECSSPNKSVAGYVCTKQFRANYSGTVTKPTIDTRTWKQEYSGTIVKPGYTSNVAYSAWQHDGNGNVTRDAFTLEGTAEVLTYYNEGPVESVRLSETFDDMEEAESFAAYINGQPNGAPIGRQNGYNFYLSNPGAYVYIETIGQYRVHIYRNKVIKPARDTQYPLGKGWSWKLPYVETKDQKTYVHLMEGGSYEIQGTTLKGYPWNGLSYSPDTSISVNGEVSSHVLATITGAWKQYFSADGRLLQISDNHNNQVQFMYSKNESGVPLLTAVRDAVGNTIQISYSPTDVTISKGNERVVYHKRQEQNVELLDSVTDAKGRNTSYSYLLANASFNLLSFDASRGVSNPYALMTQIQHPTGASTVYTYENTPVKRYMGVSSFNEAYRMKSRRDQMVTEQGTNEEYNRQTVFYNGDMGSSYQKNLQFSAALDDGLTVSTYNYKKAFVDTNTSEQYYLESSTVKADQIEKTTNYSYEKYVSGRSYAAPEPTSIRMTTNVNGDTQFSNTQYDDYGSVIQSTDDTGAMVTNTYDDKQRLRTTRESADTSSYHYTELARNGLGDVTEMTIRRDNASGELLQRVKYDGIDDYGNVTSQTILNGNQQITTRTEYGGQYGGAYPTSQSVGTTDVDGKKSVIRMNSEYDLSTGRLTASTDGKNQRTTYQYDVLGRVMKVIYPDGKTLEVSYDDQNNTVTVKNELGIQTQTRWNALGWKTREGYWSGQGYQLQSKSSYDSFGRLDSNSDALGNATRYFYDNWSRPTQTGYADGSISRVVYNDASRTVTRIDAENYQIIESYDTWGRKSKTEEKVPGETSLKLLSKQSYDKISGNILNAWDGNNNKTSYTYDVLGQLNLVTNAKGETTQYSYDMMGHPVSVTYADGNQKSKEFNELGQVIKVTDEKNQVSKQYYDENGNLIRRVDRNGQATRYDYDVRDRLQQRESKDETVSYTYDATGKRTSMTDTTGKTSYQYDPSTEQLTTVTFPDGLQLKNQYDANGNRTKMKDPFDGDVFYTYDALNRLTSAGTDASSPDAKYTYYKNGLLEQTISLNGLKHQFQYTGLDMIGLSVKQGEQFKDTFKYTRDGNKNIIKRQQQGKEDSFQYDALNRIKESSEFNTSYEYNVRGNRQILMTEKLPKMVPSEHTFDAQDRLTRVVKNGKTIQYAYNGDGLLVGRTEGPNQTRYYYDGDQIIAEASVVNGTPQLKARYIRGQKLEAIQYTDGTKAYPSYNGHGDVIELRDQIGNVLNTYAYDIWGNMTSSQEKVHNPFRYSGELWDDAAELQYLRARWYDPSNGRFINEDTYEGDISDPLSLNLYTYVQNNPLIFSDPTGHEALPNFDFYEMKREGLKVIEGGKKGAIQGGKKGGWFGIAIGVIMGSILIADHDGDTQANINANIASNFNLPLISSAQAEKFKNDKKRQKYVYRAINDKDVKNLVAGKDLSAKNPYGLWNLTSHIAWGSVKSRRPETSDPWISTSRFLAIARTRYDKGNGTVVIDLGKVNSKYVWAMDHLDPKHSDYQKAVAFARTDQEYSVFQYVNRSAIVGWIPKFE